MQHLPSQPLLHSLSSQQQSQAIEGSLDIFKNQTTPALLQACGLHFHHPGNPLFTDFSATIRPGITLIKGGDGRGKSTLLRLLAGALSAQKGTLQIKGVSLHDQPLAYRQQVFWTESRSDAFDALTALAYFESVRRRYEGFNDNLLSELIEGLGLTPHLEKQLFMLSTGSKRKVWIAAAFASNATVTLLDEPFAALDTASINFMIQQLQVSENQTERAWILADYQAPAGVPLAGLIDLGE